MTIHSDQCRIYAALNEQGFAHKIINHRQNIIDRIIRAHILSIEVLWCILIRRNNMKVNGVSPLLESQLKEKWWQSLYSSLDTIFDEFLTNMKTIFLI